MSLDKLIKNITIAENGCWNWNKSVSSSGYGNFNVDGKYWSTHKYSYFVHKGEIPEGAVVRHTCHNRKCCNPNHLVIGSHQDNWKDSEEIHRAASSKLRHKWFVNGIQYDTCKDVVDKTGLSMNSVIKYTDNEGIFDVDKYRESCIVAGWIPKV